MKRLTELEKEEKQIQVRMEKLKKRLATVRAEKQKLLPRAP